MQGEVREENKMGVMPILKLIISMSLPIMASMLVQALYNIVDSVFVAQISENALTAVSMAFPIQNLMIAVSTGTGVGINALLSRNLGARNYEKANEIASHAIFLAAASYLVFLAIGIFGSEAFFRSQTDIEEIIVHGTEYIRICCCLSLGLFVSILCERMLQSTGKTVLSMYSQGAGAITNIIMDPILIFGMFGFPAMGVAGAAYATVAGQIVSAVISVTLNIKKNKEIEEFANDNKLEPDFIKHTINDYEFSEILDRNKIRAGISSDVSYFEKKSLVEKIMEFIISNVTKYQ